MEQPMKWWWLTILASHMSPPEQKARAILLMFVGAIFLLLFLPEQWLLQKFGLDDGATNILGLFIAIVPGILLARPIGGEMFQETVNRGDKLAAERLAKEKHKEPA
jgi:hypothetical protein